MSQPLNISICFGESEVMQQHLSDCQRIFAKMNDDEADVDYVKRVTQEFWVKTIKQGAVIRLQQAIPSQVGQPVITVE